MIIKNSIRFVLLPLLALSLSCRPSVAQVPRIAVFDPQTSFAGRFRMDPAEMDTVAKSLQNAGWETRRLTAAQLADPTVFEATKVDVLVLRGDAVPREAFPEIEKFARDGGILVALAAKNPFSTAATQKSGKWNYSPETPTFAWQTDAVSHLFGLHYLYRPALADNGLRHTVSPTFKKYLPALPDWTGKLPSTWVIPEPDAAFYALVRSRRGDGRDVPPQIYIARKENRTAVICAGDFWTKDSDEWKFGPQTTLAMVRLAIDLKRGILKPLPADRVVIPADLPPPEPLTTRIPSGEVNPENAPVVQRWGKFDGSGLELSDSTVLPRVLKPGAAVRLPRKADKKPLWLRIRAGVSTSGANLKIETGGTVLWNEQVVYVDAAGPGNTNAADLGGIPLEFNRRMFFPPSSANTFTISNLGSEPLYFDAVQLENAPIKPVKWITSMVAGWNNQRIPTRLPQALTHDWSAIRAPVWLQDVKAPGVPDRWDIVDQRITAHVANMAPLDLVIEGTPEWAALSPERYQNTETKKNVPPDPQKYREIVAHIIQKYGAHIGRYEIWNEVDSNHYFEGTAKEYVALWKTLVPYIRKNAPNAEVMTSGLTGWDMKFVDTMIAGGLLQDADLFGLHPYSGVDAAWDKPFGEMQGHLYSRGQTIEIYNNEMGFPASPSDWFPAARYPYSEQTQTRSTDIALSRLLASGSTKFAIFQAGPADGGFAYIFPNGKGHAAYGVLEDYFALSVNEGQRLDISMTRQEGSPLTGVYCAGAEHKDGKITLVVNPSEAPELTTDTKGRGEAGILLQLHVPLPRGGTWQAKVSTETPVTIKIENAGGIWWADVRLAIKGRVTLTLSPDVNTGSRTSTGTVR